MESHRNAIGARVTIRHGERTQTREVVCGAGYLSSQTRLVHFGLGKAERVEELRVRWPSGRVQVFKDIAANHRLHLVEGKSKLKEVPLNGSRPLSDTDTDTGSTTAR